MSNKWILIKLADEFGLNIYENIIFGQLKDTNQLVRIESGYTSPMFSVAFKLSPSISIEKIEDSIKQFNKRGWGKAVNEDNNLCIGNINGNLFSPGKHYKKLHQIIIWWSEELSRFQHFDKFSKVALFKTGPDDDCEENESKTRKVAGTSTNSVDDRQSLFRGTLFSFFYATIIGLVAGLLRKYKFAIAPIEMIAVLGLVGRSFKVRGKSLSLNSLMVISIIFIFAVLLEIFVNLVSYAFWVNKIEDINVMETYFRALKSNYKLLFIPVVLVALILLSKIVTERMPPVIRGRKIDDEDRMYAEVKLIKSRISLFSFLSVPLILIPLFLSVIYILHDVVYPSVVPFVVLFFLLLPLVFYTNLYFTKKKIGQSPLTRLPRETKLEVVEDNLGRMVSSVFIAGALVLSVNVSNVTLDPFQRNKIEAVLKKDYPSDIRSCVSIPLEISKSYVEEFSFCDDVKEPPRTGAIIKIWKGHGLFGIDYFKKNDRL